MLHYESSSLSCRSFMYIVTVSSAENRSRERIKTTVRASMPLNSMYLHKQRPVSVRSYTTSISGQYTVDKQEGERFMLARRSPLTTSGIPACLTLFNLWPIGVLKYSSLRRHTYLQALARAHASVTHTIGSRSI